MIESDHKTISTPPSDIIKINLYRKLMFVCDAFEDYHKARGIGIAIRTNIIKSRMIALFLATQAGLKRTKKTDTYNYDKLKELVYSDKLDDLQEAYCIINEWLDTKKIIRVDNIKDIDTTRVELENEEKGS